MNRRFFLSAMTAIAATPALPVVAAPLSRRHMHTARILARSHNRCTPDMLARHLKVPPEIANRIQAQLLRQGVITSPVSGVSLATNPTNSGCIPNEAMKPNNLLHKVAQLRDKLKDLTPETEITQDGKAPQLPEMRNDSLLNNPSTS